MNLFKIGDICTDWSGDECEVVAILPDIRIKENVILMYLDDGSVVGVNGFGVIQDNVYNYIERINGVLVKDLLSGVSSNTRDSSTVPEFVQLKDDSFKHLQAHYEYLNKLCNESFAIMEKPKYTPSAAQLIYSHSHVTDALDPGIIEHVISTPVKNDFIYGRFITKCTCGSESVGSPRHSDWCDKHDKT